jgi:3-dehydroquinate dehydratase/shikimate dehydrogenase
MRTTTIVTVLDSPTSAPDEFCESAGDWLELRADLAGDLAADNDATWLRRRFAGLLLYTLRSPVHGGHSEGDRIPRLLRAAETFDLIDLEPDDLVPPVLAAIPPERRVVSAHLRHADRTELMRQAAAMLSTPARLYRLSNHATEPGDELAPLELLRDLGRHDVTAFATGATGLWTRILAPWLGAPIVFGHAGEGDPATCMPGVTRLRANFGFPVLPEIDELFGMVGHPVLHSLSPRIHNTAFRRLGRRALYLPFDMESFEKFWTLEVETAAHERLGFPLRGLSVVSPYKTVAIAAAQRKSPIVKRALSANVFRHDAEGWCADTTDAEGVMLTLRERGVQCRNERVAVIGCGGSGRAMAAALHQAGADVTLVNRGFERGSLAVSLLHLPFVPLKFFACNDYSIVVNATPVGRDDEELPFTVDALRRDAVVVDLVYRDRPTPLIARTRGPGRITIDGWDMLRVQARHQFQLLTGLEMPEELVEETLGIAETEEVAAR